MKHVVDICGIPYEIKKVKDNFTADAVHFGEVEFAEQVIKVREGLPKELEQETLMHEALHVMLNNIGREDLSSNETFVQSLANAMFQTCKLNDRYEEHYESVTELDPLKDYFFLAGRGGGKTALQTKFLKSMIKGEENEE